jgi:UDP-N-acetylmuramoylalanine-D-glutamate ligase
MLKSVHIYGLNAHGISACKLAVQKGVQASASDLRKEKSFRLAIQKQLPDVNLYFGEHPQDKMDNADYIAASPGIIQNAETWEMIRDNKKWISGLDLAFLLNQWEIPKILVTGSYGKTTFISLFNQYLKTLNKKIIASGNYTSPVCDLHVKSDTDFLLFEMDYQQLALTKLFKSNYSILLNIDAEGNVFKNEEIYTQTKLFALGLCQTKKNAILSDQLTKATVQYGYESNHFTAITVEKIHTGLHSEQRAFLNQLLQSLKLPIPKNEQWEKLLKSLPQGRAAVQKISDQLEFINDAASKGLKPVFKILQYLKTKPNPVLLTNRREVTDSAIPIFYCESSDLASYIQSIKKILAKYGNNRFTLAYSPGTTTLGRGFNSFIHRAQKCEEALKEFTQ